ncbi:glycosyltransferase [Rhizobium halophytocola]|uniref:Spore protein YkvP/CgeB glycosyl transferase-like domain-containing protein n=1 Tax=Rhizobium halophytocola TaxID=735519 RepID=A0ABS4E410_9HYPH|nr:glycosyltransferase [Rhizobium halophytocola]MBP1852647.1 hypothetical protein [Rhizobium halophytocola]
MTPTPLRILYVADFHRTKYQIKFFSVQRKLSNGFIRLGHNVVQFSDRDVARESSMLGSSKLGSRKMNATLIRSARTYQPHIIFFGHADLIEEDTYFALRETCKDVRLAQINVDATFRQKTMKAFSQRSAVVDASFLTTADKREIGAIEPKPQNVFYIPNPVDDSIETGKAFNFSRENLNLDLLFLGTGIETREQQINFLEDKLPQDVRRSFSGGLRSSPRFSGLEFLKMIESSAQNLNIPLNHTRPEAFLYSSDRVALLLGQGTLTHTSCHSRLEQLYDDGIVVYETLDNLVENIIRLTADDKQRQATAEKGWRIAHSRTNSTRVAKYMIERVLAEQPSEQYEWPIEALV